MPVPQLSPAPGESYDPNEKPPPFGHALKKYFAFDDDYVNLNHGSYGSLPLPVLHAAHKLSYEIERNPDVFHRLTYQPLLVKAREAVAKLVGAEPDEVVLVPNVSLGINVVLRNFEWREGDVILFASTAYFSVSNTARHIASRTEPPRPSIFNIELKFPLTHAEIVELFRAKLRQLKQLHANTQFTDVPSLSPGYTEDLAARKNKVVVLLDAITPNPGALMPWQEIVRIAREEGAWTVIDAAHSIGQEPNINLRESKPDFWVSNCHKWLYAKRGCAVLYVPKRNQYLIKSSLPTSENEGVDFVTKHDWTGATDFTPYLLVPEAIAFRQWLGGETAINDYCHQLALDGGKRLAGILGTKVLDEDGELTAHMVNVQLPLPVEKTGGELYSPALVGQIDKFFRPKLLKEWKTSAAHFYHNGAWWCRCSAQVFNELSDFDYLGKAFLALCKEAEETLLRAQTTV